MKQIKIFNYPAETNEFLKTLPDDANPEISMINKSDNDISVMVVYEVNDIEL